MAFLLDAFRTGRALVGAVGFAALLGSCADPLDGPPGTAVNGLGPDASAPTCQFPDEGCPCAAGTDPVECVIDEPITRNGQVLCQHGTRVCRDEAWSACENITLYAPTSNKILGALGRVSTCRPDEFTQTSTPDGLDITPSTGTNVDYSTAPPGVVLTTLPPGTNPLTIDSDGDGVPNIVDDCPNDNQHWLLPCTGPMSAQGFFHILPPGATATDPMSVDLQVKTVDTYLLVDTTASMGGEIANLRSGISGLMSNIQSVIPGAGLGLGMYRETPVSLDSQTNDFPFMHLLDPTTNLAAAQNITNQVLDIEGNSFWPEAGAQALYAVASGNGIGPWVGKRTCSNGGFGWPCFRSGTVPVVIVVADAPWWNGPSYYTSVAGRNRPELSHEPYPGTRGTTTIGSRNIPQATTVSSTGQIMISNDTAATAFLIGDMTDRSLTVHGANNGATTRLVNDFTEACGGRTPSGPDVFYTFTIDTPRHFIFEAFGDFDPTLYLRRVNAGVASTMACNLDSGSVADGNGNLVWRTGAKIDTRTIPGVGATTTNVSLTGCSAGSGTTPTPMTGCSIATQTTAATLTGCSVPSTTYTSNLSGCTVDNTPTTSTFTGCSVPSYTDSTVSGCSFENTTTAATLTGCTIPSTSSTSRFTGCQIATPTSTTLNSCTFPTTTTTATLANCSVSDDSDTDIQNGTCTRQWQQTTNLSGCSFPNVTTTANFTGCTLLATVSLSGCYLSSGDTYVSWCDANGVEVGTPVTGSGIPAGTTVASITYTWAGDPRIVLSNPATSDRNNITITNDVTNRLTNCSSGTPPQVGMSVTGNSSVVGTGNTIASYSVSSPYTIYLATPPSGSNGACGGSGSGGCGGRTMTGSITAQNLNQMTGCTVSSGSAPASGARVVGTGWVAGTTISSVSGSGPYTLNFSTSANSTSSTLTGLETKSNTVWENCVYNSGPPIAVGQTLNINNGPGGTTTITAVSGTGPYTITTSQAITNSSADIRSAYVTNGYFNGTSSGDCRTIGSTLPTVGMSVSGTNLAAGTTITQVNTSSRACAGSNGTSSNWCSNNCVFNADGTCSGCSARNSCNGSNSRWFYWTDIDISKAPTSSSATLTSASSTTTDLTQLTGCTIPGGSTVPQVGWSLAGTMLGASPTIASISGSSPYTIGLSAGAALNSSSTFTSATGPTNLSQFVNCTLMAGDPVPVSGMVVTGTNLGGGTTTINGTPTLAAGKYTIPITPNAANASATMSQAAATTYTTNRVTNCTRSSGTLQNGQTVTGTNLPGSPVVANLSGSGTGPYSFDFGTVGSSTTAPTYTVTGATITATDLTHMINCAVTGLAPANGDVLQGTGWNAGATVASTTGSGPYRINFSANAAMSSAATLTGLRRTTTPQLTKLVGCTLGAGSSTPAAGMTLAGTSLISAMAPLPTIVGTPTLAGGTYTITMSANASGSGAITTVTGTSNNYNYGRLVDCVVTGDPLQSGMTLAAANVAAGTTISGLTAQAGGKWAFNISNNSSAVNPMATSASIVVNDLLHLTGCTLSTGSLTAGMPISGTRLAANTVMTTYSGSGTGPYTLTLDRNALSVGATTASASLTVPLPQLTGCQGNFLLLDMIGVTGPGLQAGTTINTFTGLGTAGNPWTINLSATPITTGNNITVNALMPGLSNQLTGCMIASGGPLVDATGVPPGMAMSGPLVAGGSTLTLATGSGAGPYTLTLSDNLTGIAECSVGGGSCTTNTDCDPPLRMGGTCTVTTTTASGTITTGASGGAAPLAVGTYQLVVDSGTQNAASAGSPGRGTFQLRMTNLTTPPGAADATQSMDVPWATTSAALNAAGIKTIGIASCPGACVDLSTKQDAYATCVQGASPTNTTGADNTSLSNTYCGATYNRCIALFGAGQAASCSTVFNDCRAAEISAGRQNINVRTNACSAAQTSCNRVFTASGTNCTSVYNYCRGSSGSPASPATSAVCTAQANAVTACFTGSVSSLSDASQYCDETIFDLSAMGTATSSVRTDGTPFVYQIAEDGSGLTSTIADGVRELAQYILFDVTASCETAGSLACTRLFTNAVVPRAGATSPVGQTPGCQTCSGPTCTRCTPGAQLPYAVNFGNAVGTGIAQTNTTQVFDFFIVLRDATGAEMSRAPVRIVVPPVSPVLVAPSGTYTQLYDGALDTVNNVGCPYPGRRADWGNFVYTTSLPAGTSIVFQFRTGDTVTEVNSATPVTVTATSTPNATVDVGAALVAAGQTNFHRYVRLTAVLNSDSTQTLTPVLQNYTMNFTCIDAE